MTDPNHPDKLIELREAIARIIDPKILWGEEPDGTTDYFTLRQAEAVIKADAILAIPALASTYDHGKRDGIEAGAGETGWLIEENAFGDTHWIALADNEWPRTKSAIQRTARGRTRVIESDKYRSPVVRAKDANSAVRFARKEDAEAFIRLFGGFLLCPVATEHQWPAIRALSGERREVAEGVVIPRVNLLYAEDHPLLRPILDKRHAAACNFAPEFSGQRGQDFDRGILCAFEAVNGALQALATPKPQIAPEMEER